MIVSRIELDSEVLCITLLSFKNFIVCHLVIPETVKWVSNSFFPFNHFNFASDNQPFYSLKNAAAGSFLGCFYLIDCFHNHNLLSFICNIQTQMFD